MILSRPSAGWHVMGELVGQAKTTIIHGGVFTSSEDRTLDRWRMAAADNHTIHTQASVFGVSVSGRQDMEMRLWHIAHTQWAVGEEAILIKTTTWMNALLEQDMFVVSSVRRLACNVQLLMGGGIGSSWVYSSSISSCLFFCFERVYSVRTTDVVMANCFVTKLRLPCSGCKFQLCCCSWCFEHNKKKSSINFCKKRNIMFRIMLMPLKLFK